MISNIQVESALFSVFQCLFNKLLFYSFSDYICYFTYLYLLMTQVTHKNLEFLIISNFFVCLFNFFLGPRLFVILIFRTPIEIIC